MALYQFGSVPRLKTGITAVFYLYMVISVFSGESLAGKFEPAYISAENLNQRFELDTVPLIFDVRSTFSYQDSHIKFAHSMPYGKVDDDKLALVPGLEYESEIVTYCGCPRHLSTEVAKFLAKKGYSNVKVLYEGYWHWKKQNYPTVERFSRLDPVTVLRLTGVLYDHMLPMAETNIFVRHIQTGQLEAAKTDLSGRFEIDFHLLAYNPRELFDVYVSTLRSQAVKQISLLPEILNRLDVNATEGGAQKTLRLSAVD